MATFWLHFIKLKSVTTKSTLAKKLKERLKKMKKSVFQRHPWRILVVAIACVALAVAIIYLAIPMADPVADTASSNERSIQTLDSKVRENKNSPSVILQKDLDDANTTSEEKVKTWEEMTAEDKHILYDKAAKLYMSGEWDGTEIILDGKTLKLASQCGGYILADGHQLAGYHNLDMPDNVSQYDWNTTNWVYVPGNGTYVIANKHIVKYLRGEENILPGEDLQWKGIQNTQEELEDISTDDYVYGTYK